MGVLIIQKTKKDEKDEKDINADRPIYNANQEGKKCLDENRG